MTTPNTNWDSAEILEGLDILDKSALIGVPFRITGVAFQYNNSNVSIAYIDAENQEGYNFTFLDSSTGVRAQLVKYLTDKGLDAVVESGEYQELSVVAPEGLRLSKYMVDKRGPNGQPIRGQQTEAKTYYLTTNGKRGAAQKASKPAGKATPKRANTPAS